MSFLGFQSSFPSRFVDTQGHLTHVTPKVQMQIEARYVSDVLRGDDTTEMKITLLRYLDDEMPPDDE